MSTSRPESDPAANEVRLRGRLSGELRETVLPSGDVLVAFRVVIPRAPARGRPATVDTIDCVALRADVRRKLGRWSSGDVLELVGALRRRWLGPASSRYEVEVRSAVRVSAAAA